jgi:hypothetical protein
MKLFQVFKRGKVKCEEKHPHTCTGSIECAESLSGLAIPNLSDAEDLDKFMELFSIYLSAEVQAMIATGKISIKVADSPV